MDVILEKKYWQIRQQLILGGLALLGVFLLGTFWYHFVEKWRWLDAVYMTAITLSTVGFLEVHPMGDRGRIFTISLIALGLITIGYIVNRLTEALIGGYFQEGVRLRQEYKLMNSLSQHYILCGFGRTGRQIAIEFQAEGVPFVIVDALLESVQEARQLGYTAIQGDATLDETLTQLGVDRAICIVAAVPSDAENLYIVLSAKALNPTVRTIARANSEEALKKLQRVGADAVVSPYITGGKRMAAAALRPQVMDFVEGILTSGDRTFYMEEFQVRADTCTYVGQTLREASLRAQTGALVLAIRREDGTMIPGPTGETILMQSDVLICMGTDEQLRNLNQIMVPIGGRSLRPPRNT